MVRDGHSVLRLPFYLEIHRMFADSLLCGFGSLLCLQITKKERGRKSGGGAQSKKNREKKK